MLNNLHNLGSPLEFWEYFENISKIPHCSGDEGKIREYIKDEAEKFNYETKIDKAGNILVIIPPKKEIRSIITIQSHMDMVCEKNKDVEHDFSKDPLKLKIITSDGKKWLTAEGTTLGADNATGMAYSLAIMKKIHKGELIFEDLEIDLLFTVSEESGMFGAMQIEKDLLRSKSLINLDSGGENVITIGCVGALITYVEIRSDLIDVNQIEDKLKPLEIKITGLLGGHSGDDIDKGRANSIKLITKVLWKLNQNFSIFIKSIDGGGEHLNALPREAKSIFYAKNEDLQQVQELFKIIISEIKKEYSKIERHIEISLSKMENYPKETVFSKEFQDKFLDLLISFPHGPISMHPQFENLVHTSTNLAFIITKRNRIKIESMQRSFENTSYKEISDKIIKLFKDAGLKIKFKQLGGFGEWNPNFDSPLLKLTKETYENSSVENIIITALHVGLEPGVFLMNYPDLDMVAIGPTMYAPHSPDERLSIQSVENFWKILVRLLKNI